MRRLFRRIPQWLELSLVGLTTLVLLALGSAIVWAAVVPIPSIDSFENRAVAESTKIFDRTGNVVLYDVHGAMRRTAIPLKDISPYIQQATIAIEDASFYEHRGFRPLAFARAAWADITTGSFGQGGSTITQQVVKNALLTRDKTPIRKAKEIILALRLERVYSKEEILQTYLNENPYGGTIYGVQEASQYFFGVDASSVDLAQAAYLAALPQAPTYYSPYGNHRDALDNRKNLVLLKMKEAGYVSEEEYKQAKEEKVEFRDETDAGIKAPHFVFYIREYLEEKYGVDAVSNGGLRVVTTLDYDMQQKAEETVSKHWPDMEKNFNASNEGMVAIEPKTGQILAMVGSRGYFDENIDGKVNVTISHRQPGSSFKPFVYAAAFEGGYTPETMVFDVKTQFSTHCQPTDVLNDTPPCYSPDNFDGNFAGPVSLRNALAQSKNIPAIKTLYLAGIKDSIEFAQSLGITTLGSPDQYGLTLVLGGGEVTLLDMTGAYGVFANDGIRNPTTGVLRVEDNEGTVLEQYEEQSERVMDPQIAREINDILSDNVARTPEFGANSPLYFPGHDVADKTGTTNDYRDVWILGYTPGVSVGAWAGNNNNEPMEKRIAAFIIAPMWHEFMEYAIEKYPSESFVPPAPEADPDSLPPVLRGNWNTDMSQGVHDILYWVDKNNPRVLKPGNPAGDVQFPYWDYAVQFWVQQNGGNPVFFPMGSSTLPVINLPPAQNPDFRITSPQEGAVIPALTPILFTSYVAHPETITRVTYYLNGAVLGSSSVPPYSLTFTPIGHGPATVHAEAMHNNGLMDQQTFIITVQ